MFAKFRSFATQLIKPAVLWPLGLFTICLIIAIANFQPGVWLTGWDTLHPEFDFSMNLTRMIFGAWREDQGLGAVAAHSHMSDLPRILVLWLFSWIMPLESVKFVYVLLCLILGPLGIYFFTTKTLFPKHRYAPLLGFTSGLIYLCNLGTVQHFYVVFEMFAVQYAALGWIFWFASDFLHTGKYKKLFLFCAVVFLAAPMAYASTLWFAFAVGFALYLLLYSFLSRSKIYFFRTVIVGLLLLLVNSFWLLPNLYFLFSDAAKIPQNSHINELFSSEAFLHNQAYGTIRDIPLLRNFLFNWTQYEVSNNSFSPLLQPWIQHLKNPVVLVIGYCIFLFSFAGGVIAVKRKNKSLISMIAVAVMSIFMVINANPPFEWFFNFLRNHSNLFEEGLRFPFTKFSLLLMFAMSVLAAQTLAYLFDILRKKSVNFAQKQYLLVVAISVLLCYYFFPAFSGNLINKKMKNDIPNEYFELFDWFKTQPAQARVAQLPLQTNSGWDYYSWNYEGPGFIWFGINQPLLVRDFDRWSPQNETFYNQASRALYSGTKDEFFTVLKQYNIHYLLVDKSIMSPGQENYSLAYDNIDAFLKSNDTPMVWHDNFLEVYDIQKVTGATNHYTQVATSIPISNGPIQYNRLNPIYSDIGEYISTLGTNSRVTKEYPLADLSADREINLQIINNTIILERSVISTGKQVHLVIPAITPKTPITTSFAVEYQEGSATISFLPPVEIELNSQKIEYPIIEEKIVVPLQINPEELAIGFGSTYANVKKGEKSKFIITSLPGTQSLKVYYSDASGQSSTSNRLYESTISSEIWSKHFVDQTITFTTNENNTNKLIIRYPSEAVPSYLYDTSSTKNCAQNAVGVGTQVNGMNSISLEASHKGAACKFLSLPQTTLNDSFIINMQGENQEGRSLKYYVRNTITAHNELEHILPENQFNSSYTVLRHSYASADNNFYNPYALTLETKSFGNRTSSNELSALNFYPLSVEWLSHFHTRDESVPVLEKAQFEEPISTNRLNNAQYDVHLTKDTSSNRYLTFNQAVNGGWIAFPSLKPWMQLQHFSFNGWANAWLIPAGENKITIIFWPQLLSFFGYGLLVLLLPLLFYKAQREKPMKQNSTHRTIITKIRLFLQGKLQK